MRDLFKVAKREIKLISNDIHLAEEKKRHSRERAAEFIESHKASSQTQKRIEAVRRSIQHKPQSDQ